MSTPDNTPLLADQLVVARQGEGQEAVIESAWICRRLHR
jgi:hypothetical protein